MGRRECSTRRKHQRAYIADALIVHTALCLDIKKITADCNPRTDLGQYLWVIIWLEEPQFSENMSSTSLLRKVEVSSNPHA